MMASLSRFKVTSKGIRPEPLRSHVSYLGLLHPTELLGEVVDTYRRESDGVTCLRVKHFNGEPWPIEPPLFLVDVIPWEPR